MIFLLDVNALGWLPRRAAAIGRGRFRANGTP